MPTGGQQASSFAKLIDRSRRRTARSTERVAAPMNLDCARSPENLNRYRLLNRHEQVLLAQGQQPAAGVRPACAAGRFAFTTYRLRRPTWPKVPLQMLGVGTGVPVFTGLAAFACGIAGHCEGNQSPDPLAYGFAPEKVV